MLRTIFTLAAITSSVFACPDHTDVYKRASVTQDWNYDDPSSWGSIKAEYATCSTGTTQSPINLSTKNLSKVQSQTFNYSSRVSGSLGNSGYGPSFTASGTVSSKPSFTAAGKDYYLAGFHTHTTSEHTLDSKPTDMELHLVHTDSSGTVAGVIGFPIEVGASSPFFAQILSSNAIPGTASTSQLDLTNIDMSLLISEVGNMVSYWTYSGSLTTPPCTEGLRWWVSAKKLSLSQAQVDALLAVSALSARGVQVIKSHGVGL